jgi:hypothetical protein
MSIAGFCEENKSLHLKIEMCKEEVINVILSKENRIEIGACISKT